MLAAVVLAAVVLAAVVLALPLALHYKHIAHLAVWPPLGIGVDYFVESHLGKLMVYLAHRIQVSVQSSIRHDTDDYVFDRRYDAKGRTILEAFQLPLDIHVYCAAFFMVAAWFVLTLVCVVLQYLWSGRRKTKVSFASVGPSPCR